MSFNTFFLQTFVTPSSRQKNITNLGMGRNYIILLSPETKRWGLVNAVFNKKNYDEGKKNFFPIYVEDISIKN